MAQTAGNSVVRSMPRLKVIPINRAEADRERLIRAVGAVLARVGFDAVTPDLVAAEAGLPRSEIFRQFQGLRRLVGAYARSPRSWPTAAGLIHGDAEALRRMAPAELMATFFKRYLRELLDRPETLDVMAWEALTRNALTRAIESGRERTALEFFELMDQDPPADVDLTALVLFMAGGIHFLAVRSRTMDCLGGVDLASDAGWRRIEELIDFLLARSLGGVPVPKPSSATSE